MTVDKNPQNIHPVLEISKGAYEIMPNGPPPHEKAEEA